MHKEHLGLELRALLEENAKALAQLRATTESISSQIKTIVSVIEVAETGQIVQKLRAGDSVAN
jgi:hypothetical protein